jgi:hypothetical protein
VTRAEEFEQLRPLLFAIAYRILGSVSEAAVQETWLRYEAVGFTPEQFQYAFTNTLSREESDEVYGCYHVPALGRLVWAGPLANITPGHQVRFVD